MTEKIVSPKEKDRVMLLIALLSKIVSCLVDNPSAVSIEPITKGDVISLQVRVANGEVGKLVGKQGRIARSLRTILSAAGMKLQLRCSLHILEEDLLTGTGLE